MSEPHLNEHPTHNLSDYIYTCYGCGKAVGDPLLAEECPTPDAVGLAKKRALEAVAHRAIQYEFDPDRVRYTGPTGANGGPTRPIGLTGLRGPK